MSNAEFICVYMCMNKNTYFVWQGVGLTSAQYDLDNRAKDISSGLASCFLKFFFFLNEYTLTTLTRSVKSNNLASRSRNCTKVTVTLPS